MKTLPTIVLTLAMLSLVALSQTAHAFDHGALDRALRATVRNGRVDYAALRTNTDFAAYLAAIARADVSKLSSDDRLAFWINAYNALVIRSVTDHPGIRRPLDVAGFFDARRHSVAGGSRTLNQIEHDIIRKEFKEPLIHFGLVCAAVSCPPLLSEAYAGRTVRARLSENARRYLASSQNGVDRARKTVQLSQIFEWFREDFGGDRGLQAFVRAYAPKAFVDVLNDGGRIEFRPYDWSLNGK
jgi:hypothetical protein